MAVALTLPTIVTYFYFVAFADESPALQYGVYTIGKSIQFSLPVVWVFCVARENLRIRWPRNGGWWWAVSFAAAAAMGMFALYVVVVRDNPRFSGLVDGVCGKVAGLSCDRKWAFSTMSVFYALVHSLLEEYYWRWFVFDRLKLLVSVPMAIVISSVGFMAHHVLVLAQLFHGISPLTVLLALSVGVGGAFWAWLYHRSGSLWPCWLSHALVDAAIFAVGYQMVFSP